MFDVAIIGAGVIGTAVARELMRYKANVVLIEKQSDVACGASKANSGVVHAGYDAPLGSQMSYFNVLGNALYDTICEELDIPFSRIGSLLLAFTHEDLHTLEHLKDNGTKAGVPGLTILDREAVLEMEPHANPNLLAALYAPSCGIIEPWEIALAYAENAVDNGCKLLLDTDVTGITQSESGFAIHCRTAAHANEDHNSTHEQSDENETTCEIMAHTVINCAGVFSDRVYKMVAPEMDAFGIKPRRGQYFLLDKSAGQYVKHVLFPCPTSLGKGVLVLPTMDGNLLVGPDAEPLPDTAREDTTTDGERLARVKVSAMNLVDDIPFGDTITTFSGIRAESSTGDFLVGATNVAGFYQAAGIKSPGLSSAPAIGQHLADLVATDLRLSVNGTFQPRRRKRIHFMQLPLEEQIALLTKDPRFGRVICRCESITEGEIVDIIHRSAGARTVNGVKRRARPGGGRCQGGFCLPRVMEILARELQLEMTEIRQENNGSIILTGETKECGA